MPIDPTFVFIHGMGDGPSVWQSTIELLEHPVTVVTLPGFSGRPWNGENLDDMADELVEHVGDKTILVGHSMGGMLATFVAQRVPKKVSMLVNIDSGLTEGDRLLSEQATQAPDIGAWIVDTARHFGGRFGIELLRSDSRALCSCASELVDLQSDHRFAEQYRALRVRKMYVHGDTAAAATQLWLRRYRLGVLYFPDTGHWPMEERPERFARYLREWATTV